MMIRRKRMMRRRKRMMMMRRMILMRMMRRKMRNEDDGDAKEWTQTSNAMYLTYLYPDFQNKGFKMRDEPEMLFQMLYYVF